MSLFFLKNKSFFENKGKQIGQEGELTYNTEILGNLVNRDTDGDGIPDWEESLWGTDPTKKETTPGTPDSVAIEKLKVEQGRSEQGSALLKHQSAENLTETDKFSREFFSTVATLNQNGVMDQATIDKISSSLADHIQNTASRKVYLLTDIKVINDDSKKAIQNYNSTVDSIYKKYPVKVTVMDVLKKFIVDENNVDTSVLPELDPIIIQTNKIIAGMVKTSVPQELANLHLELINSLERLEENMSDIKLYDTDIIVALSAISQYETNTAALESVATKLGNIIESKLNS